MESQSKPQFTAKHKRVLKLALDAVMLVLLVLMYRKQVISIAFHEIGGLALIGLFVIHHLVNAKWIGTVTRKLFDRKTPGLVRARYIVDVLLLLSFLAVGITGIFISKVVFSLHVQGNFKTLHYFAAALAIILMGVHLGLHADYIFGKILRKGANKAAKVVLCVVLAAMIAFGGYSLFTTSFLRFLAAPLQAASLAHGEFRPGNDIELDGSSGERPSDLSELPEFSSENGKQPPQDGTDDVGEPSGGTGQGGGQFGGEGHDGGQGEGGSGSAAMLIAQYVSIITLFGAATYGIVHLTGKRKRCQPDAALGEIVYIEDDETSKTE